MGDIEQNQGFLRERLKEYNKIARERTDIYRKDSQSYFKINLTLGSALITTLTFFITFFNNPKNLKFLINFFFIIIGVLISLIIVFWSFIYEFSGKDTNFGSFKRETISFYKDNVPDNNKPDNLEEYYEIFKSKFKINDKKIIDNEETLLEDDIKNLFVLHYYASNYQRIAKYFRRILKSEVLIIFSSIIFQLFFCLFLVFGLDALFIITLCFIIGAYITLIPFFKIIILGIYTALNQIKKRYVKLLNLLKNLLRRFGL